MTVRIRNSSRFRFGSLLSLNGVEFWDLVDLPTIASQPDDIRYRVKGFDRIDTLALRFYQDPAYWWVIALANGMELLPTELNVGEEIVIPSPRYVRQSLFTEADN